MFSGIVEGKGRIEKVRASQGSRRLQIKLPPRLGSIREGDSLAVNGCCLTVAQKRGSAVSFDLSYETLRATSFGGLKAGDPVNLERAVRPTDRLGGHLVLGHVDGTGKIASIRRNGNGLEIEVGIPRALGRYLIPKGSIAVDGVSMTIHRLKGKRFALAVIPETVKRTTFGLRKQGDRVNLEVDIVGKYIESFLQRGRKD